MKLLRLGEAELLLVELRADVALEQRFVEAPSHAGPVARTACIRAAARRSRHAPPCKSPRSASRSLIEVAQVGVAVGERLLGVADGALEAERSSFPADAARRRSWSSLRV
jgi:hypothetical protein